MCTYQLSSKGSHCCWPYCEFGLGLVLDGLPQFWNLLAQQLREDVPYTVRQQKVLRGYFIPRSIPAQLCSDIMPNHHLPFAEDSFQTACKNSSGQYAYSSPENIHMVCIITIITPSNSKSSMNTNPCVNVVTVGQMGCEDIPSDSREKGVLQLFKCL